MDLPVDAMREKLLRVVFIAWELMRSSTAATIVGLKAAPQNRIKSKASKRVAPLVSRVPALGFSLNFRYKGLTRQDEDVI
ncbi:hypothetical protein [Sinorhizobium fredii]|uniref:hypothetical protein n=1 Tax=Rhizobium fredii TaxID=380 RepID=UPI0004B1C774|nr:hypothetical protein [Sinorhizobium fredii]